MFQPDMLSRTLVLLLLVSSPLSLWAQDAAATADAATKTETLKETLSYLASDELKGRGIGSPGLEEASQFVAQQL